ncbi:MAG: VOC family protein [Fusobacterium sp. JB019]|nr:VOC family protein [Fusobacterium sp. JB019]
MKIEHIAIWTKDIEKMKKFYCEFFKGESNAIYINEKKGFKSYFIKFSDGCRLELMNSININETTSNLTFGIAHIAFVVGDKNKVNEMTEFFRSNNIEIVGEPRVTGDGYYESVILDPEGNTIELVANK